MEQKRIDDMKKEYDTYPVPEQALERIKAGIAQAEKEEKDMKKNKSGLYRFGKAAGISAVAAMAALVLLANSSENVARAMEQIPVIGAIAKVVTFRNYSDNTGNFEANVDIPQITDENSGNQENLLGINKTIEEYADQLIAMYEHDLQASEGEGHYALESTYEVVRDDDRYLSIRINSLVVMGSGNQFARIFNVDKETGELLTLKDLFADTEDYITVISDNIKEQMQEQMAADENLTYFIKSEEDPYGFDTVTEENNFYLNEQDELVIVFDEYEVAPGFLGVVEFAVPRDVIAAK